MKSMAISRDAGAKPLEGRQEAETIPNRADGFRRAFSKLAALSLLAGVLVPMESAHAQTCDPVFTGNPVNVNGLGNGTSTFTTDTAGTATIGTTFSAITRTGNPATNGSVSRSGTAGGVVRYEQASPNFANDGFQYSMSFARPIPVIIAAGPNYAGPPSNMDSAPGTVGADDEVVFTAVGMSPGFSWIVDPVFAGTATVSPDGLTVSFRGTAQTNPRQFAQYRLRTPAGATMTGVNVSWRSLHGVGTINSAQHNVRVPGTCRPVIQFVKRVTNDNGAAAAAADFNIATSAGALTFGANTGTAQNAIYRSNSLTVNVGSYTMNEIDHPQYNEGTWSCTGVGTTQVGTAFNAGSVTLAQGAVATCSITNDDTAVADLSITKTNTPTVGALDQANDTVDSGQATTYTLVVTNDGTTAVTGAVVRDAPGAGITCPAGNAVTISGDGVPAGSFTVADLTGSTGIVLGALGAGQRATLSFNCQVN
ncbi:DUF11 domain-containing protein [Lysobacter gummosus]|uniref:DUF11 domain-containing protein n=1 Tax=Lysobacter gummosus TaxID=262324 RepID=A0ABY3XIX8_9GAMM|nr:DUF11 domain-containing protein [Lysobacter gummosus]UNP31603.1 DUF11 domain-containing protein [Lysobacter gummosus]